MQVPQAAATFPASVVRGGSGWDQAHIVASRAQAAAKIHVFVVKKVPLVESAYLGEYLFPKDHEHARYPVRRHWGIRDGVVKQRRQAEQLAKQVWKRWKITGVVFYRSRGT